VTDKGVEQPANSGETTPGDSKSKPAVKASAEFSGWQRDGATRIFRS
jgi:hypothetical protein